MHSVLLLCSLCSISENIMKLTAWCNSVNVVSPLLSRCCLAFCSIKKVFIKFTRGTAVCTSIFVVINCCIGTRPTFTPKLNPNNSVAFLKCFQCTPKINQLTLNLKFHEINHMTLSSLKFHKLMLKYFAYTAKKGSIFRNYLFHILCENAMVSENYLDICSKLPKKEKRYK